MRQRHEAAPARLMHGGTRMEYSVELATMRHARPDPMTDLLRPMADAPSSDLPEAPAAADACALLRERAARYATEAALAAREALLGALAHDLRGPLNTIQTWVHVLEAQLGPAAQDEAAQRAFDGVRAGVSRQVQLLGTHVDTPRAALRVRDTPQLGPASAADVLGQSAALARVSLADARSVTLDLTVPSADILLHTDADRLEQALWNLLTFAVDASAPHTTISVTCLPCVLDEQPAGRLPALLQNASDRPGGAVPGCRFTVVFRCDTLALVDAHLPHALEAFVRETALDAPNRRGPLALASCERTARMLGGTFSHDPLAHNTMAQLVLTVPCSA
jgi:hypothetical protein